MPPSLHQIRASAGSGKTHTLTINFLKIFADSKDPERPECIWQDNQATTWQDIVATTFTNAAAAEMRSRILDILKNIALKEEIPDELSQWTQEEATKRVNTLLQHMNCLNVRTIDSLLYLIVRLSALQLHIHPNFSPCFELDDALKPFLDDLFLKTKKNDPDYNPEISNLVEKACQDLVRLYEYKGFLAGDLLRKNIAQALSVVHINNKNFLSSAEIQKRLDDLYQKAFQEAQDLLEFFDNEHLKATAFFSSALKKIPPLRKQGTQDDFPTSTSFQKNALEDCLTQSSKGKESKAAKECYVALRKSIQEIGFFNAALKIAPYTSLALDVDQQFSSFLHNTDQIYSDFIAYMAKDILATGQGVTDAICRLGSQIRHLLVDEFQDTSRVQWNALLPLIEEALSKGGSFTWVGDVKQSIYGWRGGDSTLFDEILEEPKLTHIVKDDIKPEQLEYNRRSCKNIVITNNLLFTQLGNKAYAYEILDSALSKSPMNMSPQERTDLLDASADLLQTAFQDAKQKVLQKDYDGYVRLQEIDVKTGQDQDELVHEKIENLFDELQERRPWDDIAVLVRSNNHADLVVQWLMKKNIPVITENSIGLDVNPFISQFLSLFAFLKNPNDTCAFLALLSASFLQPYLELSERDIQNWLIKKKPTNLSLYQAFQEDYNALCQKWIEPLYRELSEMMPYDALQEILKKFRVQERFPEEKIFIQRFLEILHLAERENILSFSAFLDYWEEHGKEEKLPLATENLNAVRVMTIHKAKGLQFPVVVLPWNDVNGLVSSELVCERMQKNVLVRRQAIMGETYYRSKLDAIRENIHVCYVAWTRAKEELYAFFLKKANQKTPSTFEKILTPLALDNGVYSIGEAQNVQSA